MLKEITHSFTQEEVQRSGEYFQRYTGVDMNDIPAKYDGYVIETRDILVRDGIFKIKLGDISIVDKGDGKITLENGDVFNGKLVTKAYQGLEKVAMFVSSVVNIDEILDEHDDMMETFFLEFWAVALLNAAKESVIKKLNQELAENGQKCTSVWSPGQGDFKLLNQKILFRVLDPETMGVTLDKHNRMVPFKTVSGTMAYMSIDKEEELISCDYCEFRETCPGYAGKLYQHLNSQRRLS